MWKKKGTHVLVWRTESNDEFVKVYSVLMARIRNNGECVDIAFYPGGLDQSTRKHLTPFTEGKLVTYVSPLEMALTARKQGVTDVD